MTVRELSQLYWLNQEIEEDQQRLHELEIKARSITVPRLSDMPKGGEYENKIEQYAAEIADLQAIIEAKQQQCIHERSRLERYIADIPDSLTRQIFTLRFVNRLSWKGCADHLGGGNTEDGVRQRVYRYLKTATAEDK